MSAAEFDGAPLTKREVLIAREAADRALSFAWPWIRASEKRDWIGTDRIRDELYPMPKVTRPRVWLEPARVGGMAWRVIDGGLQYTLSLRPDLLRWLPVNPQTCEHEITPERIRAWANLLLNPTEEVEA